MTDLLTAREAFAALRIGRNTGYALIKDGRLHVVRVGRRILIPRAELERFIERETNGNGR